VPLPLAMFPHGATSQPSGDMGPSLSIIFQPLERLNGVHPRCCPVNHLLRETGTFGQQIEERLDAPTLYKAESHPRHLVTRSLPKQINRDGEGGGASRGVSNIVDNHSQQPSADHGLGALFVSRRQPRQLQ
jgi:hypothetical protein